jgi:hypothetical protein
MILSRILSVGLLATITVLSGPSITTAQMRGDTARMPDVQRVDCRGSCSERRGNGGSRGTMGQIIEMADANGDRAVTQDEIDTFRAGIVADADTSGEGDISLDEFQGIYLKLTRDNMVDAFQRLDADGDGAVTQPEMDRRLGDVIDRMDRNGDGKLDRDDRGGRDQNGPGRNGPRNDGRRG